MRISCNIIPYFSRKLGKMSQNLSSAAVVIGALRVKKSGPTPLRSAGRPVMARLKWYLDPPPVIKTKASNECSRIARPKSCILLIFFSGKGNRQRNLVIAVGAGFLAGGVAVVAAPIVIGGALGALGLTAGGIAANSVFGAITALFNSKGKTSSDK